MNDPVAGSSALPRARLLQQAIQPLLDRIKSKADGPVDCDHILHTLFYIGGNPTFTTCPARFRYGRGEEIVIPSANRN